MKSANTTKKIKASNTFDWSRFDATTEAQRHKAAISDPDAQPITSTNVKRMKLIPRAKTIRRALGLTQEEFSSRFHIPIGTLRDWEQERKPPDQTARAYLLVIALEPEVVERALRRRPRLARFRERPTT